MNLGTGLSDFIKKIVIVLVISGGLYLVYRLRYVVLLLFLITVISYTLLPFVEYFEKLKVPRALTTAGILGVTVALLGVISVALFAAIKQEINGLISLISENYNDLSERFQLDQYLNRENNPISTQEIVSQISTFFGGSLSQGFQNAIGLSSTIFGALFTIITAVTVLFYLVYDPNRITHFVVSVLPKKYQDRTRDVAHKIQHTLSKWLRGQLFLMIIMGFLSFIGYAIIGIPYPLILGILVGIVDIVPVVGPLVALIPILLVTVSDSPFKVIFVLIFFFTLQIIEANVLVPRVMSKTVGLDALYVIVALLIGSTIGGILGGLLAIPASVIIKILYEEYLVSDQK